MTSPRVIDADQICTAVELTCRNHMPDVLERLGLHVADGDRQPFTTPTVWDQAPTEDAVSNIPRAPAATAAITSTGLATPPVRRGFDGYDATWRIVVAVYGRGRNYNETASRIRKWAAVVRTTLLRNPTLGDIAADSLEWVDETFRQRPEREAARTLAGCAVLFDVGFSNVVDLPPLTADPSVLSTRTSITVR